MKSAASGPGGDGRIPLGRQLARSLLRKLAVIAVLLAVLVLWAGWQYSRRQAVDSQTLGDYRIDGGAVAVLVVEPDVSLDIGAGLRRDYTVQGARSDEERFGQTAGQASGREAAARHQAQTRQALGEFAAPVLRVSLQDLKYDGRIVSEQHYRVELLDPRTLQPSWRATLTWREGRYQSIALLWHLRRNRLPPPLWDSLADLAIERLREDGAIVETSAIH